MSRLNRSGSFEIVGETSEEYHAGLNKTGSSKSSINWNDMLDKCKVEDEDGN